MLEIQNIEAVQYQTKKMIEKYRRHYTQLPRVHFFIKKDIVFVKWMDDSANSRACLLREREVVGSNPGRAIQKALKMVPVATLLGAQHCKASTGSPVTHY